MSRAHLKCIKKQVEDFTRTWRYKAGISLIILGHTCLLLVLILPLFGIESKEKIGLIGVLIASGDLITLSRIFFLGKAGFIAIKKKLYHFFKKQYITQVGPIRQYIGITFLGMNFLTTITLALYAWAFFEAATPEDPFPLVWMLDYEHQKTLVFWLFLGGALCFFASFYVLGAKWWGQFRNILIWKKLS